MGGIARIVGLIGALALIAASAPALAGDYASPSFTVKDPVISAGGGFATSSVFQLWSAIGQPAIGISSITSFTLKGGFLYFPAPSTATTTPLPSIVVSGGGGGIPAGAAPRPKLPAPITCDFNGDGRCGVADLSIILYFYGRSGPAIARLDLSRNGTVDFEDISILFYYWTIA